MDNPLGKYGKIEFERYWGDIMSPGKSKYELYDEVKNLLTEQNFNTSEYKEINYGLQFQVEYENTTGLIRIYESKKGTRIDLSQISDSRLLSKISETIQIPDGTKSNSKTSIIKKSEDEYPSEIIGIDESGKGDYFGPLVIAGVYIDKNLSDSLESMGVIDSKKLKDKDIEELANKIKSICDYSIVVIGNSKYNELYLKINNLNKLLAWGHARTIENLLEKVDCNFALSDQFGDEKLIINALLDKGKKITLFQRTKAEEITAVAAASILARNEYVNKLKQLSGKYSINFPKGASDAVLNMGREFINKYSKDELINVAKLHFKTTEQL